MKTSFLVWVATGMLLTGCGKSNSNPHPQGTSPGPATNTAEVAKPAGGYLNTLMQADKAAVKTIDISYLNEAVQLFNTQEGHLPKDLNELVPNYVAKLPAAPYGSKLAYDANSGVVTVVKE